MTISDNDTDKHIRTLKGDTIVIDLRPMTDNERIAYEKAARKLPKVGKKIRQKLDKRDAPCVIDVTSSRMCENGVKGCTVRHGKK
jgi:hypothetical protein